jgi:hypothetical protein
VGASHWFNDGSQSISLDTAQLGNRRSGDDTRTTVPKMRLCRGDTEHVVLCLDQGT